MVKRIATVSESFHNISPNSGNKWDEKKLSWLSWTASSSDSTRNGLRQDKEIFPTEMACLRTIRLVKYHVMKEMNIYLHTIDNPFVQFHSYTHAIPCHYISAPKWPIHFGVNLAYRQRRRTRRHLFIATRSYRYRRIGKQIDFATRYIWTRSWINANYQEYSGYNKLP